MLSVYDSYIALANNIVERATQDYVIAAKTKKNKGIDRIVKDGERLCELRDFFYSEWFKDLTGESPDRILRHLRYKIEEASIGGDDNDFAMAN